jgi:hypothetical protein
VTPSKTGYHFTPDHTDYTNVTADQTAQDYAAALNPPSISGNAGVGGATITYDGGSTTADSSGDYSFPVTFGWTGTVTPSKTGYHFTPDHSDYTNVMADQTAQDYSAISTEVLLGSPAGTLTSWDKSFDWTGMTAATDYWLEVQSSGGAVLYGQWNSAGFLCGGGTTCSTIPAGLNLPNGNYRWRILDYGAYGYGVYTAYQDFTLNLNLTQVLLGSPAGTLPNWDQSFNWTGSDAATDYWLEVQTSGGAVLYGQWNSAGFLCGAGTTCSTVPAGLSLPNGSYRWRIRDYGAYGYGVYTAYQDFTLSTSRVVLGDPAGTLTNWDQSFNWTGISGATDYRLEVQTSAGAVLYGQWNSAGFLCGAGTNCSMVPAGLSLPNGSYKWRIQDYGAYGYGFTTDFQDFTLSTSRVVLGDPAGTMPSWDQSFNWTGISGATDYWLEVQTSAGAVLYGQWNSSGFLCGAGTTCSTVPAGLSLPSGSYKWRIQDYGPYGYGYYTAFQDFDLP